MKLSAVLFDLDNTLIMFEELIFFKEYTKKLSAYFSDLIDIHEFSKQLIYSTQMMLQNNGEQTNAEYFINSFANGIKADKKDLWQRFMSFYSTEFEQFRSLMKPLNGAHEVVFYAQERGLKIVIATNPMFPMNVQMARLRWAGLDDLSFDLITTAENTTFCKPRLEYYNQICEIINVQPESCIMVGNDQLNDMIASKIGMKTFLTTDSDQISIEMSRELAKNTGLEMPTPDFEGPLKELTKVIDQLL